MFDLDFEESSVPDLEADPAAAATGPCCSLAETDERNDATFMRRAIQLAQEGKQAPDDSEIGCVIVLNGKIVGEAYNEVDKRRDPTAHAEIVAIRRACQRLGTQELRGATLYTTLQPCGMCSMASIWAKLGRIVYGAGRHQVHRMYFEDRHLDASDFVADAFKNDIELQGGVVSNECVRLYVGPDEDVPENEQVNL